MSIANGSSFGPRYAFWGVAFLLGLPLACSSSSSPPVQAPSTEEVKRAEPVRTTDIEEPLVAPVVTHAPKGEKPSASTTEDAREEKPEPPPKSAAEHLAGDEPLIPPESFRRKAGKEESVSESPGDAEEEGMAGVGLSGAGTGGGGLGRGAGFGAGHGRLGGAHKSAAPPRLRKSRATVSGRSASARSKPGGTASRQRTGVAAGEWDDNANFQEFTKFLKTQSDVPFQPVDVSKRRFLVVKDKNGKAVPNCQVTVRDSFNKSTVLTTGASGRAVLFPRAEGLNGKRLSVKTNCEGSSAQANFTLKKSDGVIPLQLDTERDSLKHKTVDVVFILDTTGSMSEEIRQLKSTITKVADTLGESGARIRLGMVEYRDRGDVFLTRVHQMTTDVDGFVGRVDSVHAGGGGDMPEDVNEGLAVALEKLNWNEHSVARTAFLIGDAPPQLGYQDSINYSESMRQAAQRGIHLYTIAASGMDGLGQVVWRQLAQYTGGTNMFVLRGGAGPASIGGGDPKSSCGGTHTNFSSGNLSELIRGKVRTELATLNADPMKIPGLHGDEKAKPCDQRVVLRD